MKIRKPLKLIGGYSIFLGLSIIVMWIQIIMNKSIPEGKIEISFHLFSEFLMALLCILSGFLLIRGQSKGQVANSAAHAMVLYSLINAMGYYAERNEKIMVAVFIFLAILSFIILIFYLFHPNKHYL